MAYKAGSKIICEIISSKFYPRSSIKNIGFNSVRLSHVLATRDKARRLNKDRDLLFSKDFWRGLKTGIMSNLIVLKLINSSLYAYGCLSKFSTATLSPVGQAPQVQLQSGAKEIEKRVAIKSGNRGAGRLNELLLAGNANLPTNHTPNQRKNLNELAFKHQHTISSDIKPKNQKRLKGPSKFSWTVSATHLPSQTKYQFLERRPVESDVDFTDNLSTIDAAMKRKLNTFPPKNIKEEESLVLKLNSLHSNKVKEARKSKADAEDTSAAVGRRHVFKSVPNAVPSIKKDELVHMKPRESSGSKQKRNTLQSSITTKNENTSVSHKSAVDNRKKYVRAAKKSSEYLNPESIAAAYSLKNLKKDEFFHEPIPKYRLKRDLISVVLNTTRIPLIERTNPSKTEKTSPENRVKVTSLLKSAPPLTNMQNHRISQAPKMKTWNFAPRRARTPSRATPTTSYGYKLSLSPSGTALRQTIVVNTPKHNLGNYQNTLEPPGRPQSKTRVAPT